MTIIDVIVSNMKRLAVDAIGNAEEYITEADLMKLLDCAYAKRAYALGRAIQQLIFEDKIYIDDTDLKLHLIETQGPGLIVTHLFPCPYCEHTGLAPRGLSNHVNITHPLKYVQFLKEHFPAMEKRFKEIHS